jgi:hypothetical protein
MDTYNPNLVSRNTETFPGADAPATAATPTGDNVQTSVDPAIPGWHLIRATPGPGLSPLG